MSSQTSSSGTASPATSGIHTHDEDSDHEQLGGRVRKRVRKGVGPKPKKKPISLGGIIHVPMDIFVEIMSHLEPIDLISIARTTRRFRTLLMQRSAKHIWHAAERNIPGLPHCPEHLSEPAYAALVFVKHCSMCGLTMTKRMDEVLAVRLCSTCRDRNIIGSAHIPTTVQPFVPLSTAIMPPSRLGSFYALVSDMNAVVNTMFAFASNGDSAAFERWKTSRIDELKSRIPFINALIQYLDDEDDRRDDETETLKAQRFTAIKDRLTQIGWEEVDCYVTHYPLMRDWVKLVYQPKPLTERIWENIYPKLVPILEANKHERLARERRQRKIERKIRLRKLVADIGDTERRFVELAPEYDQPPGPPMTTVLPFPNPKTTLKLQFVKDILRMDITADAAEELFTSRREEFDLCLKGWKYDLERGLVEIVSKKGGLDSLMFEPEYPGIYAVGTSTKFTSESEESVKSTMLQTLLRADSVFKLDGTNGCRFYPDVITTIQDRLLLPSARAIWYDSDATEDGDYDMLGYKTPLNLAGVSRDSTARTAAKAILASLGLEDAAYLEMKALGERFVCERCFMKKPMGWAELLDHYSESEKLHWNSTVSSFCAKGIAFNELHKVPFEKPLKPQRSVYQPGESRIRTRPGGPFNKRTSTTPDPTTTKPMVKVLTIEEAEAMLLTPAPVPLMGCQFCEAVVLAFQPRDGWRAPPRPRGSREEMIQHLAEMHEIGGERAKTALLECLI
ncbi:hypothetical protein BDV93DRAFT_603554 [Ceratobasidium sp. AG-I]|nr:hypothetical protein BDV93DRAFT_603554 [Ceratobasidium sp. AG-I]